MMITIISAAAILILVLVLYIITHSRHRKTKSNKLIAAAKLRAKQRRVHNNTSDSDYDHDDAYGMSIDFNTATKVTEIHGAFDQFDNRAELTTEQEKVIAQIFEGHGPKPQHNGVAIGGSAITGLPLISDTFLHGK